MQIAWSSFNRFVDFCDCWEVEFHKYRQSLLFVHYSIHFLGLVIGHVARKVTQKKVYLSEDTRVCRIVMYNTIRSTYHLFSQSISQLYLRASLCKILISSFAHKMDFAHNFSVDFF